MATAKMSKTGAVILPKAVRDAHGLEAGAEFEIIDGGREITLRPVDVAKPEMPWARKQTIDEFLASIPRYEGPPVEITEDLIRDAIDRKAIADWNRLERQWHGNKDD
jgi:AbrB family looped-hinge helix DNA binding protein